MEKFKGVRHSLHVLKNLAKIFQVHHLQIIRVNYLTFWFIFTFSVFVYPNKLLFLSSHSI